MKNKINEFLTSNLDYRYVDKLQGFTNSYNKIFHSTVDTEYIRVTHRNKEQTWISTFLSREKRKPLSVSKQPYIYNTRDLYMKVRFILVK